MNKIAILFMFTCLLLLTSCSIRYIRYRRAVDKLQCNEISESEFDKKFYSFKKHFVNDTSGLIKFKGAYVYQDKDLAYRFYKFSAGGQMFGSHRMAEYPTQISMLNNFSGKFYYRIIEENRIELEYLNVRDWNLYNNVISGFVSGDTLLFTEIRTVQIPWLKPDKISRKCIYDSTLTVSPT